MSEHSSPSTKDDSALRPYSATSFFGKSPQLKLSRTIFFKILLGGSFALVLIIFAVFSIYWGALWKTPAHALPGFIVDFDNGAVGQAVTQGLLQSSERIVWSALPASDFPDGPNQVANSIIDEKAWVAVVINNGATSRLTAAASTADASYSSSGAITVYALEARNENAFRAIIRPTVQGALGAITQRFARQFVTSLAQSNSLAQLASTAPQVFTEPVGYTLDNLRPFDMPVATAVTFVGLIYLLILSFFLVMVGISAREVSGIEQYLTTGALIRFRLASIFILYFFISLFYSLLSLAFQMEFTRNFGHAGFIVFWMLNWVGMLSVGMALEAMITLLTVRFVPFFMILWIITNVSVCFLPIEVQPKIFHYGYAMPFYNVSRAVRTIVFNTKNTLGQNFGILIGWAFLSCLTLAFLQWFVRRAPVAAAAATKTEESQEL